MRPGTRTDIYACARPSCHDRWENPPEATERAVSDKLSFPKELGFSLTVRKASNGLCRSIPETPRNVSEFASILGMKPSSEKIAPSLPNPWYPNRFDSRANGSSAEVGLVSFLAVILIAAL
ncbi:MAG: hypothetical protein MZV63_63595 [Marinilabiliales bacterium]|nr:hypothetical protein [Marinilabiliales bacterium]